MTPMGIIFLCSVCSVKKYLFRQIGLLNCYSYKFSIEIKGVEKNNLLMKGSE